MILQFLKRRRQSRAEHLFVRRLLPGNSWAMIGRIPEELPLYGSHNEELHVSRKYVDTTVRPRRSAALLALQFTEPSPVKS